MCDLVVVVILISPKHSVGIDRRVVCSMMNKVEVHGQECSRHVGETETGLVLIVL